jgi:peroxiredoxin Q/BCP
MGLQVGDQAPDFTATTFDGRQISLSDYRGKRGVVLFFYPKDGTSVCTKEACAFRDSYEKFADAGAEVIGVSGDSNDSHQKFSHEHKLSYPLISDADGSLRKKFTIPDMLWLVPRRVTYVIDKDGTIRMIFSALLASDDHVRNALDALGIKQTP